ncbi:hypothetical protein EON83_07760 [bacterium]|nr:MAG: hypothetical protein EON83_07760 [bacterium]
MRKRSWGYVGLFVAILPLLVLGRAYQSAPRSFSWTPASVLDSPSMMVMGFAPNGHILSAHSDEQLRDWDVIAGQAPKTKPLSPFLREGSFAQLPVFSRDGKWGAAQDHNRVLVWDVQTGRQAAIVNVSAPLNSFELDFSADGKKLAVAGETLASASDPIYKRLPSTTPRGFVEVLNWSTNSVLWSKPIASPINSVSWADNGDLAVAGGVLVSDPSTSSAYDRGGVVEVWNPALNKRLMRTTSKSHIVAVVFSPDAKSVVASQSFYGTNVFNARTGALKFVLKCPVSGRHGRTVNASPQIDQLRVSGDSRYVAGSGERGRRGVKLWRLSNGQFMDSYSAIGAASEPYDDAFALSVDGNSLAVASSARHQLTVYPLPK